MVIAAKLTVEDAIYSALREARRHDRKPPVVPAQRMCEGAMLIRP